MAAPGELPFRMDAELLRADYPYNIAPMHSHCGESRLRNITGNAEVVQAFSDGESRTLNKST